MATITINTAETIEFREADGANNANSSFVTAQLGEWDLGERAETGIVIDASGPESLPAVLSANNARKLAKWLTRAADQLERPQNGKSSKKRQHYEDDEDDNYGLRLDK